MVVSDPASKEPGGSLSPAERVRRKPRQDWLVAVGQGRSPARTLRRESRGRAKSRRSSGRKKFDKARLSFGGLEQDRQPGASQSPPPPRGDAVAQSLPSSSSSEPRPRQKRPSTSASSPASSKRRPSTSDGTAPATLSGGEGVVAAAVGEASSSKGRLPSAGGSPRSDGGGGGGGGVQSGRLDGGTVGSPFRRSPAKQPRFSSSSSSSVKNLVPGTVTKPDWLSAAISKETSKDERGDVGGDADGEDDGDARSTTSTIEGTKIAGSDFVEAEGVVEGGGRGGGGSGGRDAKLSSLLLLSPGKDYWTGRIAAHGARDSESPRTTDRSTGRNINKTFGWANSVSTSPAEGIGASSPPACSGVRNDPPSPAGRHPLGASRGDAFSAGSPTVAGGKKKKKEYQSFTAVKRVAPLSPVSGTVSPSVWSSLASASPSRRGTGDGGGGGGGVDGASARGKGRLDPSPWRALRTGEIWSPSSTHSLPSRQASPSLLPLSPVSKRVAGARREETGTPALGVSPAAAAAAGGMGGSFGKSLALRISPVKDPAGAGREEGSWSADAFTKQTSTEPLQSQLVSPSSSGFSFSRKSSSADRRLAGVRTTSPSSLPSVTAGGRGSSFGRSCDSAECNSSATKEESNRPEVKVVPVPPPSEGGSIGAEGTGEVGPCDSARAPCDDEAAADAASVMPPSELLGEEERVSAEEMGGEEGMVSTEEMTSEEEGLKRKEAITEEEDARRDETISEGRVVGERGIVREERMAGGEAAVDEQQQMVSEEEGIRRDELVSGKERLNGGEGGADASGGVLRLELQVQDLDKPQEGVTASPADAAYRPSPLQAHLYSPVAQEPSPSTSCPHQRESFNAADEDDPPATIPESTAVGEGDAEQALPSPPAVTPSTVDPASASGGSSKPPLHGNGVGFRGHVPPGVRVIGSTTTASADARPDASSGGGGSGSSSGGGGGKIRRDSGESSAGVAAASSLPSPPSCPQAASPGEANLRVSTPTGDGGASDLSLWVTTRNAEKGGQEGAAAAAATVESAAAEAAAPAGTPSPSALSVESLAKSDSIEDGSPEDDLEDKVCGDREPEAVAVAESVAVTSSGGAVAEDELGGCSGMEGEEETRRSRVSSGSSSKGRGAEAGLGETAGGGGGDDGAAVVLVDAAADVVVDNDHESREDMVSIQGTPSGKKPSISAPSPDVEARFDAAPFLLEGDDSSSSSSSSSSSGGGGSEAPSSRAEESPSEDTPAMPSSCSDRTSAASPLGVEEALAVDGSGGNTSASPSIAAKQFMPVETRALPSGSDNRASAGSPPRVEEVFPVCKGSGSPASSPSSWSAENSLLVNVPASASSDSNGSSEAFPSGVPLGVEEALPMAGGGSSSLVASSSGESLVDAAAAALLGSDSSSISPASPDGADEALEAVAAPLLESDVNSSSSSSSSSSVASSPGVNSGTAPLLDTDSTASDASPVSTRDDEVLSVDTSRSLIISSNSSPATSPSSVGRKMKDDRSGGKAGDEGDEGIWRVLSRALCGLLNFCRPPENGSYVAVPNPAGAKSFS